MDFKYKTAFYKYAQAIVDSIEQNRPNPSDKLMSFEREKRLVTMVAGLSEESSLEDIEQLGAMLRAEIAEAITSKEASGGFSIIKDILDNYTRLRGVRSDYNEKVKINNKKLEVSEESDKKTLELLRKEESMLNSLNPSLGSPAYSTLVSNQNKQREIEMRLHARRKERDSNKILIDTEPEDAKDARFQEQFKKERCAIDSRLFTKSEDTDRLHVIMFNEDDSDGEGE